MGLKTFAVAVGTVVLMSAGVAAAAAAPSASPAAWRQGMAPVDGETTAVTGVRTGGTTTEFAFVYDYSQHWMFVRVNGGTWKLGKGPGLATGEMVVDAKAITATRLVLFTTLADHTSRMLIDNAGKWTVAVKFRAPIGNASVLSPNNIWVFGSPRHFTLGGLGVYRYDGTSWKRVLSNGCSGGGAVSATSAWAVQGSHVEHLAGGTWTETSLAYLIPQGGQFGARSLIGVYPTSVRTAYAVGTGGARGTGGPLVVLQFNGHAWKKVASYPVGIVPVATDVASDGRGGLLIGGTTGAGGNAMLLHYAKGSGKLAAESVTGMTNVPHSEFLSVAHVPGTTVNILGGQIPATGTLTLSKATLYTSN